MKQQKSRIGNTNKKRPCKKCLEIVADEISAVSVGGMLKILSLPKSPPPKRGKGTDNQSTGRERRTLRLTSWKRARRLYPPSYQENHQSDK